MKRRRNAALCAVHHRRDLKLKVADKQYELAKAARAAGNTHSEWGRRAAQLVVAHSVGCTCTEAKHHLKQRQMALAASEKFEAMINKLSTMQNAMEEQQ